MRALAFLGLLACGSTEPTSTRAPAQMPRTIADAAIPVDAAPPVAEPTFRLPEGVRPLHYDLRLEIDPAKDSFAGTVSIRVRLDRPTRTIWLHARELTIAKARYARGDVVVGTLREHDLLPIELPREELPGDLTLELQYLGKVDRDQEGLFRQRGFVFSQAEAAFARRIVPCFDEPRFKVPWKVTIVAPRSQTVLANAPMAEAVDGMGGLRQTTFAEIDAMPTYLMAVAVGPFALVDGGTVGRNKIPLRIAVAAKDRKRTAYAVAMTGKLVERLETYFDMPLPLAKLDLVAVPELFGAMEHPGLVTFASDILLGDAADRGYRRRFLRVCAHELAHQWMGNLVTMAWWDDLWLAEAFATFLGDKAAGEVGAFGDDPLRLQLDLEDARRADAEPNPSALHRSIADGDDLDETFDAIAYEKGRAVLVMFERFVGEATMRTAVRAYVTAHGKGSATTADFAAALATASQTPDVGKALDSVVRHAGAPVVELSIACPAGGPPTVTAAARDGVIVPVCLRAPSVTSCALVGPRTQVPLPGAAECPPWVVGNDRALGYYEVVQPTAIAPLGTMSPSERLARAHDVAGMVRRGELALDKAAAVARSLAASGDPYAELGAAAIARALDPVVGDADRAAWSAWLGKTFASALTVRALFSPRSAIEYARRDALLAFVPGSALPNAVVARARALLDRDLARTRHDAGFDELALRLSGHAGGAPLWKAIQRVLAQGDGDVNAVLLAGAPVLGAAFAAGIAEAIEAAKLPSDARAAAWASLLVHRETRAAAWPLVASKLPAILGALKPADAKDLIDALGQTCDQAIRAGLPATPPDAVDEARTAIDRCLARAAAAGPLRLPPD